MYDYSKNKVVARWKLGDDRVAEPKSKDDFLNNWFLDQEQAYRDGNMELVEEIERKIDHLQGRDKPKKKNRLTISKTYDPDKYLKFIYYPNTINCDKTVDIPVDWHRKIAVPITSLDKTIRCCGAVFLFAEHENGTNVYQLVDKINEPLVQLTNGRMTYARLIYEYISTEEKLD